MNVYIYSTKLKPHTPHQVAGTSSTIFGTSGVWDRLAGSLTLSVAPGANISAFEPILVNPEP